MACTTGNILAGLFAPRISETLRNYHNFDRIVRELYLSYRTHSLDVVIGKQQIAWGKMDGQFIDIINPMDRREGVQLEVKRLRVSSYSHLDGECDLLFWLEFSESSIYSEL